MKKEDRKKQYGAACGLSAVGLTLGLCLTLIVAAAYFRSQTLPSPLLQRQAVVLATTLAAVSAVPAKGAASTASGGSRRRLSSQSPPSPSPSPSASAPTTPTPTPTPTLPLASDYNVAQPRFVFSDESTDALQSLNAIACFISQLRIADVALNSSFNPKKLPYTAIVNHHQCDPAGSTERAVLWAVSGTTGPSAFGADGVYTSNVAFNFPAIGGQVVTMRGTLNNTLSSGELQQSLFSFQVPRYISGFVSINKTDPTLAKVKSGMLVTSNKIPGGVYEYTYVSAVYDPATMAGQGVSGSLQQFGGVWTNSTFGLSFNSYAVHKLHKKSVASKASSSAAATTTTTTACLDFSFASRRLTGETYNLYRAKDGSLAGMQQGFPVTAKFSQYSDPVDAYASYWGLWAGQGRLADGSFQDATPLFADGITVTKQNLDDATAASSSSSSSRSYTLRLVNAKLHRVQSHSIPLSSIKGLPLMVSNYNAPGISIQWNGTSLVQTSTTVFGCFGGPRTHSAAQDFAKLAPGVVVSSHLDCQCLSPAGTLRSSGVHSSNYSFMAKGQSPLASIQPFVPNADDYPQGVNVQSADGSLQGIIKLKYSSVVSLYGVAMGAYTKGATVTQPSTGATGTVYESTKLRIFGLGTLNIKQTSPSYSNCSGLDTARGRSSMSYLDQGTLVYQTQVPQVSASGAAGSKFVQIGSGSAANAVKVGMMVSCSDAAVLVAVVVAGSKTITAVPPTANANGDLVGVSVAAVAVGMSVAGPSLARGSFVLAVDATRSKITLNFAALESAGANPDNPLSLGCGIPAYTYVTAISSSQVALSKPLSATLAGSKLDFSVVGTTTEVFFGSGGLPVVLRPGSKGSFDTSNVFKVSAAEGSNRGLIEGTIEWDADKNQGDLSTDWSDYGIVSPGSGCPRGQDNLALRWTGVKSSLGTDASSAAVGNHDPVTVPASWSASDDGYTVTVASDAGIYQGDTVYGPGIPDFTTVSSAPALSADSSSYTVRLNFSPTPSPTPARLPTVSMQVVTIGKLNYNCNFTSNSTIIKCPSATGFTYPITATVLTKTTVALSPSMASSLAFLAVGDFVYEVATSYLPLKPKTPTKIKAKNSTSLVITLSANLNTTAPPGTPLTLWFTPKSFKIGAKILGRGIMNGTTLVSFNVSGEITLSKRTSAVSKAMLTFGAPAFKVAALSSPSADTFYALPPTVPTDPPATTGCQAPMVTVLGCAVSPILRVACSRRVTAQSTTLKVQQLSSAAATPFSTCSPWTGAKCDVFVGSSSSGSSSSSSSSSSSVGSPFWSWPDVGDVAQVTGSTLLVYKTDTVVAADDSVPPLVCASGSGQCPRGDLVRLAKAAAVSSQLVYGPPTMLDTTVSKTFDGQCYSSAKTGAFTTTYSGISGKPKIDIVWSTTPVSDASNTEWWGVNFLRLVQRGQGCGGGGSVPTVVFSGPVVNATFDSGSTNITITKFVSGRLSKGMGLAGHSGIPASSKIVSCTSYNTLPAICTLSDATTAVAPDPSSADPTATAVLTGKACKDDGYPSATLSCDESGNDLVSLPQARAYSFDPLAGLLYDEGGAASGGGAGVASSHNARLRFNHSVSSNQSNALFGPFGPLFEPSAQHKARLACDYDASLSCAWKAYQELDVFYEYEVGGAVQRVGLVAANGATVRFDQPRLLTYRHSGTSSNSGRSYDGATMLLEYNGPGQLSGLPQVCFDAATLLQGPCVSAGAAATPSYDDVVIPPGALLTSVVGGGGGGGVFLAKPEQLSERYPLAANPGACSDLGFTSLPDPPALTAADGFTAPADAGKPFPKKADLAAGYLLGGRPVAVNGLTLYELAAAGAAAAWAAALGR